MVNCVGTQIRVLDLTGTNPTIWSLQRLSRYMCNFVSLVNILSSFFPSYQQVVCNLSIGTYNIRLQQV